MSAKSQVYDALVADAAVMAFIAVSGASPAEARVYPDFVPERIARPAVAFARQDTEYVQTIHGDPPLAEVATLEIICVGDTRTQSDAVADAVQDALGDAGFVMLNRTDAVSFEDKLFGTTLIVSIHALL